MNVQTARWMTTALAGVCGVLLLGAVAQYAGVGRGYRWAPDAEGDASHAAAGAIDSKPVQLPPVTAFAAIDAHPLFNDDREPTPYVAGEGDESAAPPSPLNIALTGVIIDDANHVRIAMLQDKSRNEPIALRVGMPLGGDQSSWTLVDVKARGVVFKSAANETTEVALETSMVQPAAPKAARPPVRPAAGARPPMPGRGAQDKGDGKSVPGNSADLARRIEDRRKQMREDAERLRNGGNAQPAPPKK